MKLTGRAIDRFLSAPDPDAAIVLVFGPNPGLVTERARALIRAWGGNPADPFAFASLTDADLAQDPARLVDELSAMAFGGGPRVAHLRLGDERRAKPVAAAVADIEAGHLRPETRLVIEAGDLTPKGTLRKAIEPAKRATALPCYEDTRADLADLVRDLAAERGLRLSAGAEAALLDAVPPDRAVVRAEAEKLLLYAHGQDGEIDADAVAAVVADAGEGDLDQVTTALFDGRRGDADRALARALGEGTSPMSLARAIQRAALRLRAARVAVDAGANLESALSRLRPPPPRFGPARSALERHVKAWSVARLDALLAEAARTERRLKTGGAAADALIGRLVLASARG